MKNAVCLKKILAVLIFGCHVLFAQTSSYTFYFLPPEDDRWIAGNSYLYTGDTPELMQIDAARCGWFKKEFKIEVPEKALIYLGSQGRDKIDLKGKGADLSTAEWIPLKKEFKESSVLYAIATADGLTFRTTAPGDLGEEAANRCAYKMAAFIYDTDSSVNPSFRGNYRQPTESGLRRGLVASKLDTTEGKRKPVFIKTPVPYANWQSKESFDAAFTPKGKIGTTITNIPRCYDMPFKRVPNGTWEFDSDSSRTADKQLVGGFYPYLLDPTYTLPDDGESEPASYADCPTCNKTYNANCFNTMSATALNAIPALEYKGETYTGIDALNRANDRIEDGVGNPYNVYSGDYGCDAPAAQPRPGPTGAKSGTANLSFCFESHAEFVYEKGQEFFFRGDDDIWVFINNQLVIDLGGIHQPVPGFVDLDSIKTPEVLEEGKIYPIDIFFCERMATQSNVRVSTNMYITQKSAFYSNPLGRENYMCASIREGNTCAAKMGMAGGSTQTNLCGTELVKKGDYTVDFYMIERNSPSKEIPLSRKNTDDCKGTDDNVFTCFEKNGSGGIKVENAVYSCGERSQCKNNPAAAEKVDLPEGNWTVYARLMDKSGKQVVGTRPLIIDQFKSATKIRMVWGTLIGDRYEELYDAYDSITTKEQRVIAGKRTPIYIAGGNWEDIGEYTEFSISELGDTDVKSYSITIDGKSFPEWQNSGGTKELKFTADNLGKEEVVFPRSIPENGVDTLWVEGGYSVGKKEFNINLEGVPNSEETPDLKLTIYQPKLRFTEKDFETFIEPASGFLRWTKGDTVPPYVGKALDVYVVAWDSLRGELCEHCNFPLIQTSTTNNDSINNIWKNTIVQSNAAIIRIENGKQTIDMRGSAAVDGKNFAKWRISGLSEGSTFVEWTNLQFIDAPIPIPSNSYVYDRNGDGIGDSLVIKFRMPFKDKKGAYVKSLMPVLLEVSWDTTDNPVYFHAPGNYSIDSLKKRSYVMNSLYKETFFEENFKYWENKLLDDTTIVIADTITTFSKNILTIAKGGNLKSYTPFYDQSKCGEKCSDSAFVYGTGYETSITDKIPPIVVDAVYKMDEKKKNCRNQGSYCTEQLEVTLSEPVFADVNAVGTNLFENPFSYCFEYSQEKSKCSGGKSFDRKSQKTNTLKWEWELPGQYNPEDVASASIYEPNSKSSPTTYYVGAANGDDFVNLTYLATAETRMPQAADWVKLRPDVAVFRDAEGNTANPRELGVLISGTNYFNEEKVKIASITADPDAPVLGGTFNGTRDDKYYTKLTWLGKTAKDYAEKNLFQPGNVTELLPIPKGINNPDTIQAYYPGSVGILFESANDMYNNIKTILNDCKGKCTGPDGRQITNDSIIANYITMHAAAYYHTSIGNYTAHRDPIEVNCSDAIFKTGPDSKYPEHRRSQYGNNCLGNEYNFYLAWDLKTNKDRFVGVGAYVAISKFYWQIDYKDADGKLISQKYNKRENIDMFGVKRNIK